LRSALGGGIVATVEWLGDRLLNWASILDDAARAQAERAAAMPFVHPYLALMPDAHLGKGATVGSVIPIVGAVMPAAVGVDIGCGMIAVRTQHRGAELAGRDRAQLRRSIERAIPLSAGHYNRTVPPGSTAQRRVDELSKLAAFAGFDPSSYTPNWPLQLGSLGSGNHFIEVSVDEQDRVWLFLHSGSRGVGNRIATRHIAVAKERCARRRVDLPDRDLAYLTEDEPQFHSYVRELRWAQHFALLNREEMMDRLVGCFARWYGAVVEQERINCHHNYTEREHHHGTDVWLTRKGAINAAAGRPGLIPGSMGTASYVVTGRGNELAMNSAPHGAGRAYSRSAARRTFSHAQLREAMRGIEYRDTAAFIDETPQTYKPIDQIMADAADLVEVRHTLRQLVNVKGD
jgi:tRNA-splicing ligase RtcB (3'-phosphate/5'-hydroxy nucleic acid ligase)